MRIALLAALCVLTAACGAYHFPGGGTSPTPTTGSVTGRVLAVPCAPVEQAGSVCAGNAVQWMEIDYLSGTSIAAQTVSDGNGRYAIRLAPGSSVVKFNGFGRVIS